MLIIFDLDDTLIDTTGSITPVQLRRALHSMVEEGLEIDNFEKAATLLDQINRSSENSTQVLKKFLYCVGGDPALLTVGQKVVYGTIPEDLKVLPLPQASEVLKNLKKSQLLALVSIGHSEQQCLKMKKAGLDLTLFSKIAIIAKEDKKSSYQEILEGLNQKPAQTVVCGDRIRRDLTPAKELGCRTIQMLWGRGLCSVGPSSDVDFKIRTLSEIQGIIENL